jgi:hypothetical protein
MTPTEVYATMLEAEGLLVKPGSTGRLNFKYEGDCFELLTYEKDQQYVGISSTYGLPTGVRKAKALAEANDVTGRSKVVKVYVLPDRGVRIAAELYIKEPEQLDAILPRLIRQVQAVASKYFHRLANPKAAQA